MTEEKLRNTIYHQVKWILYSLKMIRNQEVNMDSDKVCWHEIKTKQLISDLLNQYTKDGVLMEYNMRECSVIFTETGETLVADESGNVTGK